ncbi:DUF2093 domain-containing protein [Sandaracinobacteroides saxicola]|uniref:DUF2093 domain-containing protein n=1 Tax=Sandaracinobacteroides saxicola TaxID=2759707 RepID=A0A7G5IMC1_9SPHN|nr:DUF2093 domain-containing protein [Sandaracinobacteroides saxicola]QMW24513.1 DUF2093 domain-containing protein [Sandaracinobacteroides saxicola]
MLNFSTGRAARLRYLSGSFQVLSQGDHVLCAVTQRRIPLNDLRYWSHELQEAYASGEIAVARYGEMKKQGRI